MSVTLFKNKETRKKLLLIIGAMIFIRIGSIIPIPGINAEYMKAIVSGSGFEFLNMITGNSLSQMSLFALSISPYITASIIVQLMSVVIPRLEELSKDGETGREKIQKITNITGIVMALIQSLFMAIGFGSKGLLTPYSWWMVLIATAIWTVGTTLLIFIGEKITKLEFGNGISYILLFNILASFSNDLSVLYQHFIYGNRVVFAIINILIAVFIFALLLAACIYLNLCEKRVPICFSKKMVGNAGSQELPVPLNICNVMPIIFAGSIVSLPAFISVLVDNEVIKTMTMYLSQANWFNPSNLKYSIGCIVYVLLTYFFASFYLCISFNTTEIAQNLKTQGATIPEIRPGQPTIEYLDKIAHKMVWFGTTFMLVIVLVVLLLCNMSGIGMLSIGGTSILICTNVIIESHKKLKTTAQSVESQSYYRRKTSRSTSLFVTKGDK